MIYALNELFAYRFPLKNDKGVPITAGSPMLTIQNSLSSEFWNGVTWQVNEIYLSFTNMGYGIYGYDMTFEIEGSFIYRTIETTYSIDETFEVEVSDGVYALTGSTRALSALITDLGVPVEGLEPTVSIMRNSDNLYFNGVSWISSEFNCAMIELGEGSYSLDFMYNFEESFTISINELTTSYSRVYKLTFSESLHESQFEKSGELFVLSSESIIGTDGGDAKVTDITDIPIKGAVLEIHNTVTKEVFRAVTNDKGMWTSRVPGGTYIIMINHDEFISASIERVVS